jgi:hypothetical protein
MSVENAKVKLDKIVEIRQRIAHSVQHSIAIHLTQVKSFQAHVQHLVECTDADVLERTSDENRKERLPVSHEQSAGNVALVMLKTDE